MKELLQSFLPKSVQNLIKSDHVFRSYTGCLLFADVAGFTPLTEALMVLGKEGSEELTRILNTYFEEMIEIVDRYEGDILRFSGDAMTILFNEDKGETALYCGLNMLAKMDDFKKIKTRAGEFTLEMKIGCAYGETQIGILNDGKEIDYYASGDPLDISAEAEHHAKKGVLVCSPNVSIPNELKKQDCGDGFLKISGNPKPPPPRNKETNSSSNLNAILSTLLPKYLIEKCDAERGGEHRGTTVIFLSFKISKQKGKASHKEILNFYANLKRIVSKYGGFINKIDFGDKGAKALLFFGTPYSLEKREAMASRCALEIKEFFDKEFQIKMGITSSHLFSCTIGSKKRKEFTVMGDGINLSARLMGYVKNICFQETTEKQPSPKSSLEIVTDENTFNLAKDEIEFVEKGKISVKGKSGLVSIYEPIRVKEDAEEKLKPLYGFDNIQKELVEWLKSEKRRAVLITSDIGGGKSSLAKWLFNKAKLRNYKTLKIDLHPFSRELFFSLFSRIVKALFQIKNEESIKNLSHILPDKLREFVELLYPYLGYREIEKESFKSLSPKDKRDLLFAILVSILGKIEKTVIIVDNLSFADETSLQFLSHYLSQLENTTLDFVIFSRKEILNEQIAHLIDKKIELPLLTFENVKEKFEKEYSLTNLTEKVINFFLEKSKGNPQFLTAVYEAAQKENLVIEKEGIKFIDEDRIFKTTFPDSLEAIYLKEFDKLENKEKDFLFSASALGMNISVNLLSKITKLTENEIEELTADLEKKNFIRRDLSGKRKYLQFRDTLLHQAIYSLAPFSVKREIHKKVFEEIYKFEGDSKPSVFPYLAHHSEKAEDKENAKRFHRLSARMFSERYDNLSALRHFEYIINSAEIDEDYFKDFFKLLDIYLTLGNYEDFKKLLNNLVRFEKEMSTKDLSSYYNLLSEKDCREGDVQLAEKHLKKSLELSNKSNYLYGTARALLNLVGRVYGPTGRYEEGKKSLEKLLALPRFEGDAVFRVVSLMNMGSILRHQENLNSSRNNYMKSISLAKKSMLVLRQAAIFSNLIQLYYESHNYDKAIIYSVKGRRLAKAFYQRDLFLDISIHHALSLWAKGKIQEAHSIATETIDMAILYGQNYAQAMSVVVLGVSQYEELLFGESIDNIKKSISFFDKLSCNYEALSSKLEYLRLLYFLGDTKGFSSAIADWGGRESLLKESKTFSLPLALVSILTRKKPELSDDPDTSFVNWSRFRESKFLTRFRDDLQEKEPLLRYDLKVKWSWAYLSKGLTPPFNPMKLLSKSPGGVFGLRILAILYRKNLYAGNKPKSKQIRKRFLKNLYVAKIHSADNIWNCILKDKDIAFAIKGH